MVNFWFGRADHFLHQLRTRTCSTNSTEFLARWGRLKAGKLLCAFKFEYRDLHVTVDIENGHCDHSVLIQRAHEFAALLNYMLKFPPVPTLEPPQKPFSFYLFARDGVSADPELRCFLGAPALAGGMGWIDSETIPVPDAHAVIALLWRHDLLKGSSEGGEAKMPFAEDVHRILDLQLPLIPWADKTPKLLYRGSCRPTHDPGDPESVGYLQLRSQVCTIPHDPQFMDVGLQVSEPEQPSEAECSKCKASHMSRDDLVRGRYQLVVAGYGPSYEATFMKLASGGLVLWPTMHNMSHHAYVLWYQPLLRPGHNYMTPHTSEVLDVVKRCEGEPREQERCKQVAARGQDIARCKVTLRGIAVYIYYLMYRLSLL